MKVYKSFLALKLEEYISYRKKLGYSDGNLRISLSYIDQYLHNKNARWDCLTPSFFLDFRASIRVSPSYINGIMTDIRGFFNYLQRIELLKENPLKDIPPLKEFHFIPFVFSQEQTEQLLLAVQKRVRKDESYFLKDLAHYVAITLLARCGMRISEPTRLLTTHYKPDDATIYIEKTKFKKDRLIPIPRLVAAEIDNYLALRRSLLGKDKNPYLLATGHETSLSRGQLYQLFRQVIKDMGLDRAKKTCANTTFGRPTPHSLRHSFAINTLNRVKEKGKSPQHALPFLAVYMGHCNYKNTAVYLKVEHAKQCLDLYIFVKDRNPIL